MKLVSISLAIVGLLSLTQARPTPDGVLSWDEAYAKAKKLVSQMSLEERVNVTTGTGNEQGVRMTMMMHHVNNETTFSMFILQSHVKATLQQQAICSQHYGMLYIYKNQDV